MDLGLHYWNFSAPGNPQRIADTLAAAAQTAEEAGFAEFSRQVMHLVGGQAGATATSVRFREDMKVPDWFDPGQVDVSDSASPPRGYPPNVDSLSSLGVPAWRTIAFTVTY